MTGASLPTALSVALHATLVALVLIMARSKADFVIPSPYTVTLVTPEAVVRPQAPPTAEPEAEKAGPPKLEKAAPPRVEKGVSAVAPETEKAARKATEKAPAKPPEAEKFRDYKSERLKDLKARAEREKYIADRLSAMEAKQKLRRISDLKKAITLRSASSEPSAASQAEPSILNEYFLHVQDRIWENWVFPGGGAKGLEAVVSITVMRDGRAKINGFEKSSGNAVFDQSALRAIGKASPFDPPPFEMEIGVRFRPDEE
jgi:colicin import membrane protein